MSCPCKSGKRYADCCEPFITRINLPETPEQLMRSRYTAYSQANIDYIMGTMKGEASVRLSVEYAINQIT